MRSMIERAAAPDAHRHVQAAPMRSTERSTMSEVTYSAKALAAEIGIDAKVLRGWLRKQHTRLADAKNQTWIITEEVAEEARVRFAKNRTDSAAAEA
jgi:hypothetical protein